MKKRKLSAALAALITLLACLLLSGGGLAFYVTTVRSAEFHAQATTVAQDFATAQAQATYQENLRVSNQATATANFNHSLYLQTINTQPALNDPLNLANDSYWQQSSTPDTACGFIGGAYHAQSSSRGRFSPCLLQTNDVFSDFALQINMAFIKGDSGGIVFHVTSNGSSYDAYLFLVSSSGSYSLLLMQGGQFKVLTQGYSSAINGASHALNQIMVIAHRQTFLLFVNDQLIDSVSDNAVPSGAIGVFALDGVDPTDVAFNNAQVWKL